MKTQNMYERYREKKLPKKIQNAVDGRVSLCKNKEEKLFVAGFFTAMNIMYEKYEIKEK